MYLCYVDESGVPQIPGNTSHFILCGLSIPAEHWKKCDSEVGSLKQRWNLANTEVHTAWMARPYLEQNKITDFATLNQIDRVAAMSQYRKTELFRLQRINNKKLYHQQKKNFSQTESYVHLTYQERHQFLREMADIIASWDSARLFAECIDKAFFDPLKARQPVDEQAFEQLVSRYEHYLQIMTVAQESNRLGLIIHDNNETSCKRLTELMTRFHNRGTFWTQIRNIIETPLFVDSKLTAMIQVADLCAFALRRYLESGERDLFDRIIRRADRKDGRVVGVRHFAGKSCTCAICESRKV
jgi:Protein of unknown function (DUF3800)